MTFAVFAGGLFLAALLFPFAYVILAFPALLVGMAGGALAGSDQIPPSWRKVGLAIFSLGMIGNWYVLGAWGGFVAKAAREMVATPGVVYAWPYYATGFILLQAPLARMAQDEDSPTGTLLGFVIPSGAFVVFCLWPGAQEALYGWWYDLVA